MQVDDIHQRTGTLVAERYRLLRVIGEGGMGAVFEAEDLASGGLRVAVKLIKPEYITSAEVVGRFQQEAQTVASIGHPNIVRVLDAGSDDDGPFLVLELLHGETLCDVMERRPLGFREALAITAGTLDALRAAHGVGVVHRDIKPENIFLIGGGDGLPAVKLLDFGISKILSERAAGGLTRVGTAVGTPDYMSPEQAGGGRVDGRADLWSMGAVLYQAITLQTPFDGDTYQQLLSRIMLYPHTPLQHHAPAAPPGLCAIIDRSLAKEPSQRFQSADEMLQATLAVLDTLPVEDALTSKGDEPTRVYGVADGATQVVPDPFSFPPSAPPPSAPPMYASPRPPPPPRSSVPPAPPPRSFHPPLSSLDQAGATVVDPAGPSGFEASPPWPTSSVPPSVAAPPSSRRGVVVALSAALVLGLVATAALIRSKPPEVVVAPPPMTMTPPPPEAVPPPPPPMVPAPPPVVPVVAQQLAPVAPPTIARPTPPPRPRVEPPPPVAPVAAPAPERHHTSSGGSHSARSVPEPSGPPLDSPAIMQGVRPQIPAIRACLQGARGNVSFALDIDGRGHVRSVNLMAPPAGSPAGRCVTHVLSRLSYPSGHPTSNARLFLTP